MKIFDVVIIGGRVAGSAAAFLLREQGYNVQVLDSAKHATDVVSTHFMNPRGMTYLRKLGVEKELLSETPSFEDFDVSVDDIPLGGRLHLSDLIDRFSEVHPEGTFEFSNRYACIRRPLLDSTLQQNAIRSGVEFIRGATLREIHLGPDGAHDLTYEENGQLNCVRAQFVIGADGKRSTVARLLNIPKREERGACTFACYSYYEGFELHRAILKKKHRLSVAAVPTSFGKTMVLVFGPHTFFKGFKADSEGGFEKIIDLVDRPLYQLIKKKGKRCEAFRVTVDQAAFMRERPKGRVALIGDAHCFKDQCTANGMTHALRDAFLVAEELAQGLSGKKDPDLALKGFEDRRYLDLFRFYEFTASQAEMNPLRAEEERLYRAISKNQDERDKFIGLYFDTVRVKSFFKPSRIEALVQNEPLRLYSEKELSAKYRDPFSPTELRLDLEQTCFDYGPVSGSDLLNRTDGYFRFYKRRREKGTFQYSRTLHSFPGTIATLTDSANRKIEGINFASQDYLGLGLDVEVHEAAFRALRDFGPHSAGSPMVIGNTLLSRQLEDKLRELTGKKHVLLFPTGYAAGMGSLLGLVRSEDHIVMDRLSHACLQQGARAATRKIHRYPHLDAENARAELKRIRTFDSKNAILLITEGLFSMDADSPDLVRFQEVAKEFDAYLFVDVAHDLGATGPKGTGQIGQQGLFGKTDFVMGSFSKTFASNGGFLATDSESLLHYLQMYSTPHLFSNALSPIQASVALKACEVIQSKRGEELRARLLCVVEHLRRELISEKMTLFGETSPIIPVLIGSESDARRAHAKMTEYQMAAMIIEYPIVPLGAARYRLQAMATHTLAQASAFARVIGKVHRDMVETRDLTRYEDQVSSYAYSYS